MSNRPLIRASVWGRIGVYRGWRTKFCFTQMEAEDFVASFSKVDRYKIESVEKISYNKPVMGHPFLLNRRSTSYKKGIEKGFRRQAESGKIRI